MAQFCVFCLNKKTRTMSFRTAVRTTVFFPRRLCVTLFSFSRVFKLSMMQKPFHNAPRGASPPPPGVLTRPPELTDLFMWGAVTKGRCVCVCVCVCLWSLTLIKTSITPWQDRLVQASPRVCVCVFIRVRVRLINQSISGVCRGPELQIREVMGLTWWCHIKDTQR